MAEQLRLECLHQLVIRNTIFRKPPPSVVSGYGKRSINLNKVVANFKKHKFLSQTDLTRTGIINNSYKCSIVTNGTALQLCRDTSLSQELHYCSYVRPLRQRWKVVFTISEGQKKITSIYGTYLTMNFHAQMFFSEQKQRNRHDNLILLKKFH